MKTFMDTIVWGYVLWAIGFVLEKIVLFEILAGVPVAILGWFALPILIPLTSYVAWKRFKGSNAAISYYLIVATVWTTIPIIFDYIFIRSFEIRNYYNLDEWIYYTATFLIPIVVGWKYGKVATS